MSAEQILGLATGLVFGFLLQRGGLIRFEKQVGMLLLRDFTVLKFMLSAIVVGMVGIILLSHIGLISLAHRPLNMGSLIVGGSLFGIGWALTGLCPGTSMGALGEGRLHALFSIGGMLAGAMLFSRSFDFLQGTVMTWGNLGSLWCCRRNRHHKPGRHARSCRSLCAVPAPPRKTRNVIDKRASMRYN
ncbi:MAG: YeeE/YedE family protein [Defluviitaleaceae bacterium]|nr:YeeE/YedE family protein [Defluviitaleaceae bacterium]